MAHFSRHLILCSMHMEITLVKHPPRNKLPQFGQVRRPKNKKVEHFSRKEQLLFRSWNIQIFSGTT